MKCLFALQNEVYTKLLYHLHTEWFKTAFLFFSRSSGRRRVHPGSVGQRWSSSFDSVSAFKVTLLSNRSILFNLSWLSPLPLYPLFSWKYLYKLWTHSRYLIWKWNHPTESPAGIVNFSYQLMLLHYSALKTRKQGWVPLGYLWLQLP